MKFNDMIKVEIIATGSRGNCYLIETEKNNYIFDCGKGCYPKLLQKINLEKPSYKWLSHLHNDHAGDFEKLKFAENLDKMFEFEIFHNVENKGVLKLIEEAKVLLFFATDFYKIPDDSLTKIYSTIYNYCNLKGYKLLAFLEMSYNYHIFSEMKKQNSENWQSLLNHNSDINFFKIVKKMIGASNKNVLKIFAIHSSDRGLNSAYTYKKMYAEIGTFGTIANSGQSFML